DGARPEIRRSEDRVSPRHLARRAADVSEPAGRDPRGAAPGRGRDRQARRPRPSPGVVMPREPADPGAPKPGPSTAAVHAGEPRRKSANALTTPIVQTSTYTFA